MYGMMRVLVGVAFVFTVGITVRTQQPQRTAGIPAVISPDVAIELVHDGYSFTEGPVGTADGGLFFTDGKPTRIYRVHPEGRITVFRQDGGDADGLALNAAGMLFSADRINKTGITRSDPNGVPTRLSTEAAPGRAYMAPNDLIVDARDGIYFTDPGLRSARPERTFVYYLPPGQKHPIVIDDEMSSPNGLILSLDGRTLIVNDNIESDIYAFDLNADGTARSKRVFARLRDIPAGKDSLGDGIAIDTESRIYVTAVNGIQVFDRQGQYLGIIQVPRIPANVAFAGPDKRTLYITARQALYRVRMLSQGPNRPGK
jgi:sugar lactone lactonase YvrE